MMLKVSQGSLPLSVYFKNTTARMRRFRRNPPASLSFELRQWYGFTTIDFCLPNIMALLISNFPIQGIMYLGAPFSFALLQRFPLHRRHCALVGLVIMIIGLVAASFATRVSHLILTQGVLYAIGGSMLYTPTIIFLKEWFIARKGLAFGVMWAGTGNRLPIRLESRPCLISLGFSRVCIPFLMNWGLNEYSFSTMLCVWSMVLFLLVGPLLY